MSTISNPHDKFFKESFSRLELVQGFIEEVFPVDIKSKINLNSLQLTNASFTDAYLWEHFADLVYQAEFGDKDVLITILFEHKSFLEDFPQKQLLRYMTNIWIEEEKQGSKPFMVIPVVIYHGKSNWKKYPMKHYFDNPPEELLRFLPDFDYLLFSLNSFEDYQIANFKNTFLSMATMLLKHSRDEKEQFLRLENFWVEKLKALDEIHAEDFIRSVFIYIDNGISLTRTDLIIIFTKISTTVTNIAMTIAEEIRIEERQITTENNTFNFVKGLFENGINPDIIAKSFKMPLQKVEEIIQKIKASEN